MCNLSNSAFNFKILNNEKNTFAHALTILLSISCFIRSKLNKKLSICWTLPFIRFFFTKRFWCWIIANYILSTIFLFIKLSLSMCYLIFRFIPNTVSSYFGSFKVKLHFAHLKYLISQFIDLIRRFCFDSLLFFCFNLLTGWF